MPVTRRDPEHAIGIQPVDDGVVLTVRGRLDHAAGAALVEATAAVVADGTARIEIDLSSVTDFTDRGACALVACRERGAGLAGGLHYCTAKGPGRDALLAAYADC